MRDRVVRELGELAHPRFLVYLMGPYKAFDVGAALEAVEGDVSSIPESVDFGTLVDSRADAEWHETALDLLLHVRDRLRVEPGVNAFLAIDVDVPLSEMDAASQSIAFALASNAVVYVVPKIGDNLGVGIEVGAVLEALYRDRSASGDEPMGDATTARHRERVLFVHESGVRSAMIAAVVERWEARVYAYSDRSELVQQVRLFVRDVARREVRGDLPTLDEGTG